MTQPEASRRSDRIRCRMNTTRSIVFLLIGLSVLTASAGQHASAQVHYAESASDDLPAIGAAGGLAQASPNLLANPGFEDEGRWAYAEGVREIRVPPGWFAFWRDAPPDDLPLPSNCPRRSDAGCYWARPEFREVRAAEFPNRVHSGMRALKWFSYGRMHEAGVYQVVEEIPLDSRLRFSIWLQTWMCANPSACMGGKVSDAPARMHLQVGIDPSGGIDPWSLEVIWSPEGEAFDHWRQFRVEASSETGLATVFVRSRAEWDWARMNNDVYVDDAVLEILAPPTATPVSNTLPGVRYAPTPERKGVITHTVEAGETLGSIALAYGVSLEQLVRLNRLSTGQAILPGQVLVVNGPETILPTLEPTRQRAGTPSVDATQHAAASDGLAWGLGALIAGALAAWAIRTVKRRQAGRCD